MMELSDVSSAGTDAESKRAREGYAASEKTSRERFAHSCMTK